MANPIRLLTARGISTLPSPRRCEIGATSAMNFPGNSGLLSKLRITTHGLFLSPSGCRFCHSWCHTYE